WSERGFKVLRNERSRDNEDAAPPRSRKGAQHGREAFRFTQVSADGEHILSWRYTEPCAKRVDRSGRRLRGVDREMRNEMDGHIRRFHMDDRLRGCIVDQYCARRVRDTREHRIPEVALVCGGVRACRP